MSNLDVAEQVRRCHDAAVQDALGYLERQVLRARVGNNRALIPATGAGAARVPAPPLPRAGDPLLHTHLLLTNLAHSPDRRWRTIDGKALYHHARTAGFLYQAVLRHRLTTELGVAWALSTKSRGPRRR